MSEKKTDHDWLCDALYEYSKTTLAWIKTSSSYPDGSVTLGPVMMEALRLYAEKSFVETSEAFRIDTYNLAQEILHRFGIRRAITPDSYDETVIRLGSESEWQIIIRRVIPDEKQIDLSRIESNEG